MRWLFCWRCGCDMPMLDEGEFAVIAGLYHDGMRLVKQIEDQPAHALQAAPRGGALQSVLGCLRAPDRLPRV
jgi:hypothetical protein